MKLSTLAMFGAGYVLGARAGRERFDQLRALAGRAAAEFDGSNARQRLEEVSARLDAYARGDDLNASGGRPRAQTRT